MAGVEHVCREGERAGLAPWEELYEGDRRYVLRNPLRTFEYTMSGIPDLSCLCHRHHKWNFSTGSGGVRNPFTFWPQTVDCDEMRDAEGQHDSPDP